jgi:hypothetical protein
MAEKRVVYRDDGAVKRTLIVDDDVPDLVHVVTEQDLTRAVENNHLLRELHPKRSTNKLLARGVPIAVAEKAILENWDEQDWARWLDDPDNAAFRVWPGRVGR